MTTNASPSPLSDATLLKLSGGLLLGGFLLQFVVTALFHPSGNEDAHEEIFAKYAASDAWVAIHLGQFVGVLAALGGLLVLCRLARANGASSLLARLAVGSTLVTASVWALLQGLDGVALKQTVDSWAAATGSEKAARFATAETVRWLEWGFQSYFRIVLGLSFALVGALIVSVGRVSSWLGWLAISAALISVFNGIQVGYAGLDSDFGALGDTAFALIAAVFVLGTLAAGFRTQRGQFGPSASHGTDALPSRPQR